MIHNYVLYRVWLWQDLRGHCAAVLFQSKMESWVRNVFEKQKEMTNHPSEIDGCYSTDMAIDYLQVSKLLDCSDLIPVVQRIIDTADAVPDITAWLNSHSAQCLHILTVFSYHGSFLTQQ